MGNRLTKCCFVDDDVKSICIHLADEAICVANENESIN